MMDVFQSVCVLAGCFAIAITLPAMVELLVATSGVARRRSTRASSGQNDFRLAILIPAHDEELLVGRCINSVLEASRQGPNCTVVVIADNCTDATAGLACAAGARVLVRQDRQHQGKGYALRYAFDALQDEGFDGFLVVDADSVVTPNLTQEIAWYLGSGADAVQARYRVEGASSSRRQRLMDVGLLAFNVVRPLGRHNWGLSAGITGNGFAIGRQTMLDVPYRAESIVEDLEYHLSLVSAGKRVHFASGATVYGDMPDERRALSSQRARWEGGRLRVALEWVPKLGGGVARGRLTLLEPLLDLLTLPLAYLVLVSALLCTLPVDIFREYGAMLLGVVLVHVATAVALADDPLASLAALVTTPFYIFWKLTTLRAIFRASRRKAAWVRTERGRGAV
jgi:cellulose synthase/poly-beta-1,6-N-acetylglucosamine synthase-like glycosyltransferase